jgi:hypothetical protein
MPSVKRHPGKAGVQFSVARAARELDSGFRWIDEYQAIPSCAETQ